MTAASQPQAPTPVELVTLTIDGVEVSVPKGTLVIRAAERAGIEIPRFCDHPLLDPAGACRQCLVEVSAPRGGKLTPFPKPQTSCTLEAVEGMEVSTQNTSAVAEKAQRGQIEFLLVNHPLDCPVCDKGGECPLQNQAYSHGSNTSRFDGVKRTFPKPVKVTSQIMLDRDRCILCQRCTRFSEQIAGDQFIDLQGRGSGAPGYELHGLHSEQIGRFDEALLDFDGGVRERDDDVAGPFGEAGYRSGTEGSTGFVPPEDQDQSSRPFASYFSGNVIQICPVGALTSSSYRFRSRPFDLVSSPAIAEHDACGSALRVDHRRGLVMRRLAGEDSEVNEEWLTDKDRFAFTWQSGPDVLKAPMVRDSATGELVATSWSEAVAIAARKLRQSATGVGVIPGGRLTVEDAYAYSKFARVVAGTNDIDFRTRPRSAEEADYLAATIAGSGMDVTFTDLENAPQVLLVAFEPEEEAGMIFLRLRKGVRKGKVKVATIAPLATAGATKMSAKLISAVPGEEAGVLRGLATTNPELVEALSQPGAVILAGERLGMIPGGLTALAELASATGARSAWIPRRAGDRGAVEVGLLPGLLPGGRPVDQADARAEVASLWGVDSLPEAAGRDLGAIIEALAGGELDTAIVGGFDLADLPEHELAAQAFERARTVIQFEVRRTAVSEFADVVFPVAATTHKSGTFFNWEGRSRPFEAVFDSAAMSDATVLDMLAAEVGIDLGTQNRDQIHAELAEFTSYQGTKHAAPQVAASAPAAPSGKADLILASWRLMLDAGSGQSGEPHLAATARKPVALVSIATAERLGIEPGATVRVSTEAGSVEVPLGIRRMPDSVIWLPQHSPGCLTQHDLGAISGQVVHVEVA